MEYKRYYSPNYGGTETWKVLRLPWRPDMQVGYHQIRPSLLRYLSDLIGNPLLRPLRPETEPPSSLNTLHQAPDF